MNRLLPALLVVALLVIGGIWLSRPNLPREAETTNPGTVQAQTGTSDEGSETDTSESGETETETTEPDTSDDTTESETETTQTETTQTETTESESVEDSSTESTNTTEETTDETASDEATNEETATDTTTEETTTEETTTEEAATPPALPEGFTLTPFLSETQQQEFTQAEQVLEDGKDYQTIIVTNKGAMRLELFEDETPETVNNFVFLARNHYYDGVVFHRVLQDFMAQTGDPTGTGSGGPGYQFDDEIVDTLQFDKRGLLAMANAGPGTNGSQFFITFVETPHLNGAHTIFGELLEGDDVLSNIKLIEPGQGGSQPSVIAMMTDTLETLAGQGITLAGEPTATLETYLSETLGSLPEIGSEFEIDGVRAMSGRMGETPAVGFYTEADTSNEPDVMEAVYIIERPKETTEDTDSSTTETDTETTDAEATDTETTTTETTDSDTTDTETTDTETTDTETTDADSEQ
jgi:cyclophilin family peptidyl-prolyl cis-trans isomerase